MLFIGWNMPTKIKLISELEFLLTLINCTY